MTVTVSTFNQQANLSLFSIGNILKRARKLLNMKKEWERRQRHRSELIRLLQVGPHMITDLGLPLDEVYHEIAKPFWQP